MLSLCKKNKVHCRWELYATHICSPFSKIKYTKDKGRLFAPGSKLQRGLAQTW